MKKKLLILLGIAVIASAIFVSCELFKDLVAIQFTTDNVEILITIEPSEKGPIVFTEEYVKSDLEQEIKDNGGDISNLNDVKLNSAMIELVSGEPNLNALDYVYLHVGTPGLGDKLIGSAVGVADDQLFVYMLTNDSQLKAILSESEYLIKVEGALDQSIKETTQILLKVNYSVIVNP